LFSTPEHLAKGSKLVRGTFLPIAVRTVTTRGETRGRPLAARLAGVKHQNGVGRKDFQIASDVDVDRKNWGF